MTDYEGFYSQNERTDQEIYSKESENPAIRKLTIIAVTEKFTHQSVIMYGIRSPFGRLPNAMMNCKARKKIYIILKAKLTQWVLCKWLEYVIKAINWKKLRTTSAVPKA
jgi:hypothetical protein